MFWNHPKIDVVCACCIPFLQGIRSWVVLKSQLGQPVGAVQVALQFTHIGGMQHDTCPAADCPLNK
jgi:hypothetical protein